MDAELRWKAALRAIYFETPRKGCKLFLLENNLTMLQISNSFHSFEIYTTNGVTDGFSHRNAPNFRQNLGNEKKKRRKKGRAGKDGATLSGPFVQVNACWECQVWTRSDREIYKLSFVTSRNSLGWKFTSKLIVISTSRRRVLDYRSSLFSFRLKIQR